MIRSRWFFRHPAADLEPRLYRADRGGGRGGERRRRRGEPVHRLRRQERRPLPPRGGEGDVAGELLAL